MTSQHTAALVAKPSKRSKSPGKGWALNGLRFEKRGSTEEFHSDDFPIYAAAPNFAKALQEIEQMPFSMVNDADSLRHTIKTMQAIARAALKARAAT